MYTPKPEMVNNLTTLLGSDVSNELAELLLEMTGQKLLNLLNQTAMPAALEGLVVEMAHDAFLLTRGSQGSAEGDGDVQSISDNGQSITYRSASYQKAVESISAKVLKDYESQIEAYRKARW